MRMMIGMWFNRIGYGCAVGLIVSLALVIAAAPAPYFHDFGEWLYQGKILALKIADSAAVAGFIVAPYPIPNSLAPALLGLLCLGFEPIMAGKTFLILMLAGWLWVLWWFTRRFVPEDSRGAVLTLLVAVVALASYFWYGFASYQLGLLLFFAFLAWYDEHRSASWIAGFGAVLFFAHAMIFMTWGLLTILLVPWGSIRVRRRILLALVPLGLLVLWFVLGRRLSGFEAPVADARMEGVAEFILYKFGSPLLLGGFRNLLLPDGTSLLEQRPWLYWLGAMSNALVVLGLGIFVLLVFLKPDRVSSSCGLDGPPSIALPVPVMRRFGLIVIGCYLIAPYNFFGLIHPGGRLLLPLLAVGLMLARLDRLRWIRWTAVPAGLGAILSVGAYGLVMYRAAAGDLPARTRVSASEIPPSGSVFAFNDWLYRKTRYKYLNYGIFNYSERFQQIRDRHYAGLTSRTGPLTGYQPRP